MRTTSPLKLILLAAMVLAILALAFPADTASAQDGGQAEDAALARTFAPVLYFAPSELFRPQSVDVMVNTARLLQARRNWFDTNVLPRVSIDDLFGYRLDSFALDVWYGDKGGSNYKNYTVHRAYYEAVLSPEAGGAAHRRLRPRGA